MWQVMLEHPNSDELHTVEAWTEARAVRLAWEDREEPDARFAGWVARVR